MTGSLWLLRGLETPFYLYDLDLLRSTLESAVTVASRYGYELHYAIKANYDPRILAMIRDYGFGIDTGQADSKFGISYEEILEKADFIKSLKGVNIKGMHLHIGSQIRELHVFEYLCDKVNTIVRSLTDLGFELEFVDVGGGLGINYDMPGKSGVTRKFMLRCLSLRQILTKFASLKTVSPKRGKSERWTRRQVPANISSRN